MEELGCGVKNGGNEYVVGKVNAGLDAFVIIVVVGGICYRHWKV